ncbi:carboxypeptidase-like regulatory domain-containing protein [Pedobacter sp. SYSU D00535]|uniref:carboxypeptidase-like regulatory domain-containing protein n=1 Tax=Pedobacter sp. SYSU D00535 TaxID=2810308 RepID=UPI001A97C69D|nr:carboxypeptidase-like regulatory domain-containing protein [Pedobacter sp. SYSU D00535]
MRFAGSLILLLILVANSAQSQNLFYGQVFESNTRLAVSGARIENIRTKIKVVTDSAGRFQIASRIGDLLAVQSLGYIADTLYVHDLNFREVFLKPASRQLNEVVVIQARIDTSINWHHPDFRGQRVKYQRDENGFYKGGIAISVYHNKDSKRERKNNRKLTEAKIEAEIDRVFNMAEVGKYVPLRDEALRNFVALYRPSRQVFKTPGFSLVLYLNDAYRKFTQLPPEKQKLPPLIFK